MGNIGYCRRMPPQIMPWLMNKENFVGERWPERPDEEDHNGWPITDENDWCGEWQEDKRSYFERYGMSESEAVAQ
jgi:hypothetical protein